LQVFSYWIPNGQGSRPDVSTPWIIAIAGCWALILLISFIVLGALSRITDILERAEKVLTAGQLQPGDGDGTNPGTALPPFELVTDGGTTVTSTELFTTPATLVLFMSSTCVGCERLGDDLSGLGSNINNQEFIIIMDDTKEGRAHSLDASLRVLYDRDRSATRAFRNRITPQLYAVGPNGFMLERRLPVSARDVADMAKEQLRGQKRIEKQLETMMASSERGR
jgi:hypothetical protein